MEKSLHSVKSSGGECAALRRQHWRTSSESAGDKCTMLGRHLWRTSSIPEGGWAALRRHHRGPTNAFSGKTLRRSTHGGGTSSFVARLTAAVPRPSSFGSPRRYLVLRRSAHSGGTSSFVAQLINIGRGWPTIVHRTTKQPLTFKFIFFMLNCLM